MQYFSTKEKLEFISDFILESINSLNSSWVIKFKLKKIFPKRNPFEKDFFMSTISGLKDKSLFNQSNIIWAEFSIFYFNSNL